MTQPSAPIAIEELVDGQKIGLFNINLLIWSFLAMFADGYDITAMAFAGPQLIKLWHLNPAALGPVLSASLFGILFGAPLLGLAGDRFGRKVAIIAACLICGTATLAVLAAHNLEQMMLLRFLAGVGIGGLMPNTIALNSELSPKRLRATLIVLMFTGTTLGSGSPGLIAAWLLPHFGWQVLFLIGGLTPLLVAVCLLFTLPESVKYLALRPDRRVQLLRMARRLRPDMSIADDAQFEIAPIPSGGGLGFPQIFGGGRAAITALLWICFATALMANYFLNSWLPLLTERTGMSPERAALTTTFYHVGATLGGIVVSVLMDRFGFATVAVLLGLAGPAVLAIGTPNLSHGMLTLLITAAGFSVTGAQFGNNAAAGLIYPTAFRSKAVGWAFAVGRVGSIAGPMVGGWLISRHLPLQRLLIAPAVPLLVGTLAAAVLARLCFLRFRGFQLDERPAG